MKKVFIDTSIFINAEKPMSEAQDPSGTRHKYSKELLLYLKKCSKSYTVYYDPRVEKELKDNKDVLKYFNKSKIFLFNDTYDQIDYGFWDEIESRWGYDEENELAYGLEGISPNEKNRIDRNIYATAIQSGCKVFIHDDKGFRLFNQDANSRNIQMIHLRDYLKRSFEELSNNL